MKKSDSYKKLFYILVGVLITLSFLLFTNAGFVIQTNITSGIQYMKKIFVMASDGTTTGIVLDGNGSSYFSGKVGIGTSSPQYPLSIINSESSSTNYKFYVGRVLSGEGFGVAIDDGGTFLKSIQDEAAGETHSMNYDIISSATGDHVHNFKVNGVSKMVIKDSGNVGIGTTSPNGKLEVAGTATTNDFRISRTIDANAYFFVKAPGGNPLFSEIGIAGNTIMTLVSGGNVGIGTASPASNFHVYSTASPSQIYYGQMHLGGSIGANNDITLIMGTHRTNKYSWIQGWEGGIGSSKLALNPNGGNVGIGNTSPSYTLDVTGTGRFTQNVFALGFLYNSDSRLKKNIVTIDNSLDKILALNGYSFVWKKSGTNDIGVIAQEVEKQFPELVTTDSDGFKAVKYPNLIAPIIQAIKEFYAKYIVQEKKVNELEHTIKSLQDTVQKLQIQVYELSQK